MTNQVTINKLIEMRLTVMADAFRAQVTDPSVRELSFEDRFGLLVDQEYCSRKNTRLKRLIQNAMREDYSWEGDTPPERPASRMIIYEMHVRSFTRHSSSGVRHRGTYAGLTEKIPYLKALGVNSV